MTRKPFCRLGSKTFLKKEVLDRIPKHQTYVEPFVGAGTIYWAKQPSEKEVINDLDSYVAEGFQLLKRAPAVSLATIETLRSQLSTLTGIRRFMSRRHSTVVERIAEHIIQGCSTFNSTGRGEYYRKGNVINKIENIPLYKERLQNTTVLNKDYKTVISKYDSPETFFYLDPPYEESDGLYKHHQMDFDEFETQLRGIKGKFLLSLNDSPRLRKLFSGFIIEPVSVFTNSKQRRKELLIRNYRV